MAKLTSWFAVLRWSLILTLILVIILSLAPLVFSKHFERYNTANDLFLINTAVVIGLSIFGLVAVCCYYFYLTFIFGVTLIVYLIIEFAYLHLGNIGTWLLFAGLILCSFTYCAAMRRLRREALYGP